MDGLKGSGNRLLEFFRTHRYHVSLFLLVVLAILVRMRLTGIPLERDEGEYAYAGQLILQGSLPYDAVFNMKLPGVYMAYAGIIAVFGQTCQGIHAGLALVNALTTVLLFFLGRMLAGPLAGITASACFVVLTLDPALQGIFANSEHFVILPVAAGLILLLEAAKRDRLPMFFAGGLLFGTGILMKQHGALFGIFALAYLVVIRLRAGKTLPGVVLQALALLIGTTVPYALTCLLFWSAGIFDRFWFWTVQYASRYTSEVPLGLGIELFEETARDILKSSPFVWMLAGVGLAVPIWSRQARRQALFTHGLFIFSLLSILPGLYFRRHYFLLVVPSASLLAGVAVSTARYELTARLKDGALLSYLPVALAVLILGGTLFAHGSFMMGKSPTELSRSINGLNPFPESVEIGSFIRERSGKDDHVAVIGSEPQIYFYSGRRSSTGHIYMYPLMEKHEFARAMQRDMIREIEKDAPKFLVFVHVDTSWALQPGSDDEVLRWFFRYQARYYRPVGVIDIGGSATGYYWIPNLRWPPESNQWILVFQRKEPPPPSKAAPL